MASNTVKFIEIDGSYLEGGGQILRISTALSVLLNKPIQIKSIRAGRKDGGLKAQHLTGIKLLSNMSHAKLVGGELKSTEVTFSPEMLSPGRYQADTQTAGSICLLIQSALPCLIFNKESSLDLRGGTNAENAPQIDYFEMVFAPIAKQFGFNLHLNILRRGYYPKGGGEVYLKTEPVKYLNPINVTEFGKLKRIYGRAFVAGFLPIKIAEKMASESKRLFESFYGNDLPIDIEIIKEPDHTYVGAGTGLILIAETTTGCLLAGSALGKKGVSSERVAAEAVETLKNDIDCESCVDCYMQDQLILFMALAKGKSSIRSGPLTLHTKTAIHYTELLTGVKFNIHSDSSNKNFIVECEGIGYESK